MPVHDIEGSSSMPLLGHWPSDYTSLRPSDRLSGYTCLRLCCMVLSLLETLLELHQCSLESPVPGVMLTQSACKQMLPAEPLDHGKYE